MTATKATTAILTSRTKSGAWIPTPWIAVEAAQRELSQTTQHAHQKGLAFVSLLRACAINKDLCRGIRVHDDILRQGLLANCSDAVITMYARCGALTKAQKLLDIYKSTNVFTWTALISAYTQNGDGHGALHCFQQMQHEGLSPDLVALTTILTACAQLRATDKGEKIHDEIVKQGLPAHDVVLGTALVHMYAKCGALPKAQQVHEELPARDVVSWNALITGYAEEGHGDQVLHCFQQMQFEGLSPNAVTFTSILKGCGSIGAAAMGARIHDEIIRRGLLVVSDVALGNALIDMYVKCGAVSKAQKVLEELPMRDVISWSALVVGYAQRGQSEQILTCYERIQEEGLSPNALICACALKACGSMGAFEKGGEIHEEIVRERLFGNDMSLGSALIDMYDKCGSLTKAHKVLEELPVRDALSWSALIMAFVQQGQWEKAINYFEQMGLEGLTPTAVAFASILKACGNLGKSKKGEEIHDEILQRGLLESNTILGNSLVDMYAKCGSLSRARQVLERLPFRDIVSWTTLISGYAERGKCEEALNCFEQMRQEGISPNALTYACVLKACGSIPDLEMGAQIHDDIIREGLLNDNIILGNALMHMYINCGAISKAHQVLEGLPVQDVASWSSLIAGYVQEGQGKHAISCIEQMQGKGLSPSKNIYRCALKACGSIGDVEKGEEIHGIVAKQWPLDMDMEFAKALIDMYAKCGAMEKAEQLLEQLPNRDVMVWNALIAGYAKQGGGEVCDCFERMQLEGVSPDAVTFSCILKACGSMGVADKGEIIHDEIVRQGLLANDMVLGTAVVNMYANCGALSKAEQVLEGLPARDVVVWSALIVGYVQQGQGEHALSCYARMERDGLSPDALTFVGILKACGSVGALKDGESFHHEIVRRQELLGSCRVLIGTALVDMYAKCGALLKARCMLEELPDRDAIAWSALISGYAQHGQGEQALKCFELMQREGLCPDAALFSCVLSACSLSGLIEDAQIYLEVMDTKYGVKPAVEHFTCVIDLLGRTGHLDKAVRVIDKMSSSCKVVWSALLGACRKWGDIKVGRWAFEHAIQVDKNEAAFYILMACIYRAAGLQEEADDIEAMRRERE